MRRRGLVVCRMDGKLPDPPIRNKPNISPRRDEVPQLSSTDKFREFVFYRRQGGELTPTKISRRLPLALMAVGVGCSSVFTEPFAYGTVEVEVTLPDGNGVPGLDLTLYSGTRHLGYATTDSFGSAFFDFVPEGPTGVSVRPDSIFRPARHPEGYYQTFRMVEGGGIRLTFEFVDTRGVIQVRVEDASGTPLVAQTVELYNASEALERAGTDAAGEVVFDRLPRGDYGVRVVASPTCNLPPGGAYRDGLVVETGNRFNVVIVLEEC